MHKLVFVIAATVALLLTGFLQWNAKATPMTAVATAHPKTNASLVERAGCWVPGNCTVGQYQLCDRRGRCKCTNCPGWYPWRQYKPTR
jgi:hypothetical protein